jgi:hypothetical protein
MSYFAVIREAGPGWTDGKGAMEQPGVADHAGFMNGLAEEGFVLFAGLVGPPGSADGWLVANDLG